jgi:eukaryotic translation initiation factor 2C
LGGINVIPDNSALYNDPAAAINDPRNPTIVMGADVQHPPQGTEDRPSFAAVVGNKDSNNSNYIASSSVQAGRQEIIAELKEMSKNILRKYMDYRRNTENVPEENISPKRLIFYRDGISEGQFKHVQEQELPELRAACDELNINPKITFIVVNKRHHIQFYPTDNQAERSGNCPAGTVVDTEITHPTDFDFILQSHSGILGTSRPCHYYVLHDEFGFKADAIQALSYALCHLFARATRAVSIPAPVYWADIVCDRAKYRYDPSDRRFNFSDTDTGTQSEATDALDYLERYKQKFKPLHAAQAERMYFS